MTSYLLWLDNILACRVAYITNYMTRNEYWLDVEENESLLIYACALLLRRESILLTVEELQSA